MIGIKKFKLLLIAFLVIVFTTAFTSLAFAVSNPVFDNQNPAAGGISGTARPSISVHFSNPANYDWYSRTMTVDGVQVNPYYNGDPEMLYDDEYGEWYLGASYNKGTFTYTPTEPLTEGIHTVSLTVNLYGGGTGTTTWSFTTDSPPSIIYESPANNAKVNTKQPVISAKILDASIDISSIDLKVDGIKVNRTFDALTGTVSYVPETNLSEGLHTVNLTVFDLTGKFSSKIWSFNVDTTKPTFSGKSPYNTTISTFYPIITVNVNDLNQINKSSLVVKINGNTVPASIKYGGYWQEVYEDWPYWVETDPTTAIIEYTPANPLPEGIFNVSVAVSDIYGNLVTDEFSFNIYIPPVIANNNPVGSSSGKNNIPTVSAKITDTNIDPSKITLKIDNIVVNHNFNPTTGMVSFTPAYPFAEGKHNVSLVVYDLTGMSAEKNWDFIIDITKPVFSGQLPINITTDNLKPNITATIKDANQINKSSLILKLNGTVVPASIKYGGYWQEVFEDWPYWVETDPTTAIIEYTPANNLLEGTYTVSAYITDVNGNESTTEWAYQVAQAPVITNFTPAANSKVGSLQPRISVKVTDNEQLDLSKLVFKVNGINVTGNYDAATEILSYTPTGPLPQEEYVTVDITAFDQNGNSTNKNWKFYAATYTTEMPVPNDNNKCGTCHQGYPAIHPINNCNACHGYLSQGGGGLVDNCASCHGYYNHSASSVINTTVYDHNGTSMYICTGCHYRPNVPSIVPQNHIDSFSTALEHKTTIQGCDKCHATTLTREHVLRKDASGNSLTCETCHLSPPADMAENVKLAIANKDSRCDACHKTGSHDDMHLSNLDSNCQTCHKKALTTEHISNSITQTKVLNCATCHESNMSYIKQAITSNNLTCSGCHDAAHGQKLQKNVPVDIPLYPLLAWSEPISAEYWQNESWMPDEYATSGQVIISKPSNSITGDQIWNFYNNELTVAGWKLSGNAPAAGSNFYSATFTKTDGFTGNERKILLLFYGGANHTASPVLASGYRIEIIYK